MKLLFIVFCSFFMILGIVDSIKFILFKIFKKSKNKIKSPDEAEFVIRNFANDNLWNHGYNRLILVDATDDETQKIINIAKNDFDFLDFKKDILKTVDSTFI
ncbi:MAG: hypothetical protein FWC41_11860 [Firmicutes bacterium]|nr:hypothetical protein [Bacillota bacterium]